MTRLSDEELVVHCLKGEKQAFDELVIRYEKPIYNLVYRLINDSYEAYDITQDIFIRTFKMLDKFDIKRKFFPWLYQIATNLCYNALKSQKNKRNSSISYEEVEVFITDRDNEINNPESVYVRKNQADYVRQCIEDLPENYRVPMILRYVNDLSYNEISEVMDLPVSTIETRLFRGRNLLKKSLKL